MKALPVHQPKGLRHTKENAQISKCCLMGLLLLGLLIFTGCTCNNPKSTEKEQKLASDTARMDSLHIETPFAHHEYIFDSFTVGWLSEAMGGRALNAKDFKNKESHSDIDTSLQQEDAATGHFGSPVQITETKDYYTQFQPFTRSSPDSLYLIDFGSYNHIITKDKQGNTKLEGGEPDSKVELLDFKAGIKWQILYGGPGLHIMDAKWKDKQHFMILFSNEQNLGADTILLTGDINSKTINWYKLGDQ